MNYELWIIKLKLAHAWLP